MVFLFSVELASVFVDNDDDDDDGDKDFDNDNVCSSSVLKF